VALVLSVVQWRWVLTDTIPTGGDMGAHVWGPAYLRDHLLPHWQLVGWTPDWYAGFPAFQYYMVLPSLAIVMLGGFAAFAVFAGVLTAAFGMIAWRTGDRARRKRYAIAAGVTLACTLLFAIGMPYGIAFKIVAVSGLVTLPVSAWALGRLAAMPFPAPPLLAVATLPFLFDRSFNIYGGNVASTMAGEFAFSMSLSLSVLALGLAIRALDTGRCRGWAAVVFALAGLCHIFPAVWAAVIVFIYFLLRGGRTQIVSLLTVMPVAGLLGAFWALPFHQKSTYLNDMGWEKLTWFKSYLLTRNQLNPAETLRDSPPLRWSSASRPSVFCCACCSATGSVPRSASGLRHRGIVRAMGQMRLWSARMLPFYCLSLYLLLASSVYEAVRLIIDKV
jgi:hypothetical protein